MLMHKYKDYKKYLEYLKRYRDATGSGKYAPRRYEDYEDELVLSQIMSDRELGIKLHRSVKSIQNRRRRLKNR